MVRIQRFEEGWTRVDTDGDIPESSAVVVAC